MESTGPPMRLPPDIIFLILNTLTSFDDLYALIRTSPDYYQTYIAKQQQILKAIASKALPECYMNILDVQRPGFHDGRPSEIASEDDTAHRETTRATGWIEYQAQWVEANGGFTEEAQFQNFYTIQTRPELSPVPGTFLSAELNCLMEFDHKVGEMIVQYHHNYREYDNDGTLEIRCNQLHADKLHLSMLMESIWQDEWDGEPYRFSKRENARFKQGIYRMYALTNHIHSYAAIRTRLESEQLLENAAETLAAEVAKASGSFPGFASSPTPIPVPIPQPHKFYLDATPLFSLSLREHIQLISVLYHLHSLYTPHFLLPEWLYSDVEGGLVFLHLLERFDFTQTDIYDKETGFYLNKTYNHAQTRSRKTGKGLLSYSDSYGLYDIYEKQISRMERQLKPYVTKSGYNKKHFFRLETPHKKNLLILKPRHTPHTTRPNWALGMPDRTTESQYLPKLKERLLAEDEHDPNQHFMSSMPVHDMLGGQGFEGDDEEDADESEEEDDSGMYDEDNDFAGYLALTN